MPAKTPGGTGDDKKFGHLATLPSPRPERTDEASERCARKRIRLRHDRGGLSSCASFILTVLLANAPIDALAQQVDMAIVAGVLLDHVDQ